MRQNVSCVSVSTAFFLWMVSLILLLDEMCRNICFYNRRYNFRLQNHCWKFNSVWFSGTFMILFACPHCSISFVSVSPRKQRRRFSLDRLSFLFSKNIRLRNLRNDGLEKARSTTKNMPRPEQSSRRSFSQACGVEELLTPGFLLHEQGAFVLVFLFSF